MATSEWLNDLNPEELLVYLNVVGALAAKPLHQNPAQHHV